MITYNSIPNRVRNSIISFFKEIFYPDPPHKKPSKAQTPVWDKSEDYILIKPPHDDPKKDTDYVMAMQTKLNDCIRAKICIQCGDRLLMELFIDAENRINIFCYSCEHCKIRYRQNVYRNGVCAYKNSAVVRRTK